MESKRRRPYGSGSVIEAGPGKWRLMVHLGPDLVTGKPQRRSRTIEASSRQEAEQALIAYRSEFHRADEHAKLADLLTDYLYERSDLDRAGLKQLRRQIDAAIERLAIVGPEPSAPTVRMPTNTGWVVYLARTQTNDVLYVGMTSNLWSRLGQWHRLRASSWWNEADHVEWRYCETESEARRLERALIIEHRPPHNVALQPRSPLEAVS